jgi:hypothetical protein
MNSLGEMLDYRRLFIYKRRGDVGRDGYRILSII